MLYSLRVANVTLQKNEVQLFARESELQVFANLFCAHSHCKSTLSRLVCDAVEHMIQNVF